MTSYEGIKPLHLAGERELRCRVEMLEDIVAVLDGEWRYAIRRMQIVSMLLTIAVGVLAFIVIVHL